MLPTVPIALFGWIFVVAALFRMLSPPRAVIAAVISGYVLLPKAQLEIASGVPPWSSDCSIVLFALIGGAVFAPRYLLQFRFHRLDLLPLIGWLSWGMSSVIGEGGIKQAVVDWWFYLNLVTAPYLLARIFIRSAQDLKDVAIGIAAGGILMLPLIVFESQYYPVLNNWVYGWSPDRGMEIARLGGFRPIVFMARGLAMGIWLAGSAVVMWAIWISGDSRRILGIPVAALASTSLLLGLLSRSSGAIALMLAGILILLLFRWLNARWLVLSMPAGIIIYMVTAMTSDFLPIRDWMLQVASYVFPERAFSLQVRIDFEALYVSRAIMNPIFGFGGWAGYRDVDPLLVLEMTGQNQAVVDGFWVVTLGKRGLVGLTTSYAWMLAPATVAAICAIRVKLRRELLIPIVGLAVWCYMNAADLLFNGFPAPTQGFVAGVLASVAISLRRASSGKRVHTAQSRNRLPAAPAMAS